MRATLAVVALFTVFAERAAAQDLSPVHGPVRVVSKVSYLNSLV
jgi:hypothetical protein